MQSRGITFGFHSNDHWNLGNCKDSELDTTLCNQGIEELINSNTFAYPFGYFEPAATHRLTRQGYVSLMAVGDNNARFSDLHVDRSEPFEESFAALFARLEIEEPLVCSVKATFRRAMGAATLHRKKQVA